MSAGMIEGSFENSPADRFVGADVPQDACSLGRWATPQ